MTEHDKAKAWRLARGWTLDDMAELTGFSRSSVMWMERGQTPPIAGTKKPRKVNPYAWQRYKRCCHSVAADAGETKPCNEWAWA